HWLSTEWDTAAWSESTIEHAIHGSAEECVEQLRAHVKTGVNRIILIPYRYEPPQVERVAKEVLPKLRRHISTSTATWARATAAGPSATTRASCPISPPPTWPAGSTAAIRT